MAYNPGYNQRGGGRPYQQSMQQDKPQPIKPKALPTDYVTAAERVMEKVMEKSADGNPITTTKLRGFLALVTNIYNEENLRTEKTLLKESQIKLMRLRVRVVYDAGRDKDVKRFVTLSDMLSYLADIGDDREKMIRFSYYMEALVAYQRFLGGKEN